MDANATATAAAALDPEALEKRFKAGASWFFWIAGLSLVNSVMAFTGSDRTFLVGLAVTQIVDGIAQAAKAEGGPAGLAHVALGIDVVVFAGLVSFGALTRRRPGLFLAGMVLYALDGVLCGVLRMWGHLGFHALALFFLWRGLVALRQLHAATAPAAPEVRPNRLVR